VSEGPTLGIVIPTYARPGALRRAVASVARSRAFGEIVVVDDASPDPVDLAGVATARVRVIRHSRNRGVCAARNTGTAAAQSTHLVYLDDDDALLPWAGWFYRRWIARAAARDPERIVVGGILVDRPGRRPGLRRPPSSGPNEIWGFDRHLTARGRSINTKQAAAIPKALVERVGGWDEALRSRSSSEMFYRLTAVAAVDGHRTPVYRLNRGDHAKLTADPERRAASHAHIADKHAHLLADPDRRAAFEASHNAMMERTGDEGAVTRDRRADDSEAQDADRKREP
jgi:hypothetical protein